MKTGASTLSGLKQNFMNSTSTKAEEALVKQPAHLLKALLVRRSKDKETLLRLLQNPDMAKLLKTIAASQ
jgi:hypothetical protein